MATVAGIRTGYLNGLLKRTDGDTKLFTDSICNQMISQAIEELWPDFGVFFSEVAATDESDEFYTIPTGMTEISRIVLETTTTPARRISNVTNWRKAGAGMVVIDPLISSSAGVQLRFYGWKAYASDGSDLPDRLQSLVAMKAASLLYGVMSADLSDYERQAALDSGKVVTYQDAVGLSAFWQRRYEDRARREPGQVTFAPIAASR